MIDPLIKDKKRYFLLIPLHVGLIIYCLFLFPLFISKSGGPAGGDAAVKGGYWLFYVLSLAGSAGILGLFFVKSKPLFVSSLFFLIVMLFNPLLQLQRRLFGFSFPGADYVLPFAVFFILIAISPKFKAHITWLAFGKGNRLVWILLPVTILVSAAALAGWFYLVRPGLADITAMVPVWPLWLLLLGGLGFAATNAFAEEIIFRGMIRDGLLTYIPEPAELVVTSALFAAAHVNGVPRGVWGIVMAGFWGILLGVIRNRSKGLFYPWLTHAAADICIYALLLVYR